MTSDTVEWEVCGSIAAEKCNIVDALAYIVLIGYSFPS